MTSELDRRRLSKLLFDHREADAPLFAAQRADEMLAKGNMAAPAVLEANHGGGQGIDPA